MQSSAIIKDNSVVMEGGSASVQSVVSAWAATGEEDSGGSTWVTAHNKILVTDTLS